MGNKLYVGNLAYSVRDDSLQQAFGEFGTVTSAKVMMDRDTGRSKGFGFVEMGSDAEAQAAINGMNGQALEGRAIVVNEARPREERPGGFGGGGGSRSGGGGYGKPTGCSHVIKLGETLYSIARLHGISVASLAAANGIHNPDYIRAGQTLTIPGCGGHGGPGPVVPPGGNPGSADCWTYIVKPGDTLSGIAWSTGDSVAGIASRNGILNPERIYAGKGLTVCSGGYGKPGSGGYPGKPGGKCRFTYVVKPGESLSGIAWRYGMASYALTAANGLSNPNLIYAGQVLCIP